MKKAIKYFIRFILATSDFYIHFLLIVPYFFKDEIESMVKDQASNYLDADLEFGHISISAISSFPELKLGLQS